MEKWEMEMKKGLGRGNNLQRDRAEKKATVRGRSPVVQNGSTVKCKAMRGKSQALRLARQTEAGL